MEKLSKNDKINIYNRVKAGERVNKIIKEYNVDRSIIYYLIRLINKHGLEIINKLNNNNYSVEFKKNAVERVLINNESIKSVAIDIGLPGTTDLRRWISNYRENGYNIIERKRGRPIMPKVIKKENESKDEKIKRLEEENLYLKAELEYSKKLEAVVQARKNQQQKKK